MPYAWDKQCYILFVAFEVWGMDASMISELKALQKENRRLKKMYAEVQLQKEILQEAMRKKVVRPSCRREMAMKARQNYQISIRLACATFSGSEVCYSYKPRLEHGNNEIADWLIRLTSNYRNWGFGLCYLYLRNVKGFLWNHKCIYRIYRELELNLRIKPKKRIV